MYKSGMFFKLSFGEFRRNQQIPKKKSKYRFSPEDTKSMISKSSLKWTLLCVDISMDLMNLLITS